MRSWLGRLSLASALVASLPACADDGGIGATASAALTPHARAVRAAAVSGDRAAALDALSALRRELVQLENGGQLSDGDAEEVLEATIEVESHLLRLLPAPSSTTPDVATPEPAPPRNSDGDREKDEENARKRAEEKAEEEAEKAEEEAEKAREKAEKDAGKRGGGEGRD